ncbi:hypothetical protein LTS18_001882, partial [Coniosporium uncinatum]
AVLMSRLEVQRDERWAWLWDARSVGGIWYRWKLWQAMSGHGIDYDSEGQSLDLVEVFEQEPKWMAPEQDLQFEFVDCFEDFVEDSDYTSRDEDDSDDEARPSYHRGNAPPPDAAAVGDTERSYLSAFEKAQLTWLLARLPTSASKFRRGDMSRVVAFAIVEAGTGAEDIADMLVTNVITPFSRSSARPREYDADDEAEDAKQRSRDGDAENEAEAVKQRKQDDTSDSKKIAMYIISDLLNSCVTAGVNRAWRYRQIFEAALRQRKVFEHLGRHPKALGMGIVKADRWRKIFQNVIDKWKELSVFSQEALDEFHETLFNPPLTEKEQEEKEAARQTSQEKEREEKKSK